MHSVVTFQIFVLVSTGSNLNNVPNYIHTYKNITFVKVNFSQLVADTPSSKLWKSGAITSTGYYLVNISDVIRIVLLLKFGGVYFDSDVISIQKVPWDQGKSAEWFLTNLR